MMVALKLQVWYLPKFYSLEFKPFPPSWEYKKSISLIGLVIMIKLEIAQFSISLGFKGQYKHCSAL